MSLSPEEMFYLATGLLDLNSWTGSAESKADNNEHSRTKCAAHKNLGFDRTQESVASTTFESMHPSSPRKKCCSSPSSLSSHAGRCSSECLGQVSLNNMSPSSSSGRPSWRTIYLTMLVIFLAFSLQTAEGCSSRSTPKPRPPPPLPSPTPAVRPNITFQTYACPPAYATYYCLNGATCFTIKIGESILYNCECTEGFMGQRCEYKDLDGSYLPLREKIMLERASIAGGATVAVVLVVIISIIFYTYVRQQRKEQRLASFEQVTVDRIQIRSRSCSSCNSFGGCRFGVASTKNDCLLHQQRPHQFTLSSGYKKVKHPNLISIDYAHALRLTGLACDPVSNTNAPINILTSAPGSNVKAECKASQREQTVLSLPNREWDCKTNVVASM
ncbi:uncharacterized protein LOC124204109 [Daphnia pulex]|uniref:uncharacterized protein LOC124204109 n=1 Tax=Daphnia pulex TaxID=6669 RepID=UPI001EE13EA6|nr:uncharacterized protein LOC124204109 [Daphnia pulex]